MRAESSPIALARLHNQCLEGRPLKRPVDVVRWLVASQAQDFSGAKWALAMRTNGTSDVAVESAFNAGEIIRTHLLRPTWHFVTPQDIRWLLVLTASRVLDVSAYRHRELSLDATTLRKATAVLARALEGGHQLTRDELRESLARKRIRTEEQRMAHILMYAELQAVVCSGARRGKQFTYALLDERVPPVSKLNREEALAELAGRYFASRGPATVHDFSKWSGLTIVEARRGLESVGSKLQQEVVGGTTYWSGGLGGARARDAPAAHLLSIYDEYISSYRDRSAICEPRDAKKLVGMGNALAYVVVVQGRVVGTWKRSISKKSVQIQMTLFRKLVRTEERALRAAAERYMHFLGDQHSRDLAIA